MHDDDGRSECLRKFGGKRKTKLKKRSWINRKEEEEKEMRGE